MRLFLSLKDKKKNSVFFFFFFFVFINFLDSFITRLIMAKLHKFKYLYGILFIIIILLNFISVCAPHNIPSKTKSKTTSCSKDFPSSPDKTPSPEDTPAPKTKNP